MAHFNVRTSTVDNVWNFSKLKHEDKDTPADFIFKFSKLINNVGQTAKPYTIPEVVKLVVDSNKILKNHLIQEEREACINAIREKWNKWQNFRQSGGFSHFNSKSNNKNKQQSKSKERHKKEGHQLHYDQVLVLQQNRTHTN